MLTLTVMIAKVRVSSFVLFVPFVANLLPAGVLLLVAKTSPSD